MTANHVNEIVDHVSQALDTAQDDKEQVTALERFQDEVKKDMQGMTPEQVREYMPQLTKQLEDKNQLPVLALAFAEQLGGDLSESDLRSETRSANRAVRDGDNSRQVDKVFLQYLTDNYDDGANLIETKNDAWLRDDANISQADITAKLAEFRQTRDENKQKESNQENAGDVAEQLLAGGDKSLFDFIDRNSKDGVLTKMDLQKYLSDAESSGSKDGQFAPEKQAVVKELINDWDEKDSGKWLRGGYSESVGLIGGLTKFGLVLAAGCNSEEQFFAGRAGQKEELNTPVEVAAGNADESEEETANTNSKEETQETSSDTSDESVSETRADASEGTAIADAADGAEEREPEPVLMEVRKGDSYWRMANRILGEEATPRQILEKMNELQEMNDGKPLIYMPGRPQTIKIPAQKVEPPTNRVSTRPAPGQMLV